VWHDSFMCVTWLIYVCDMTHLRVWHDSFTCVAWLIYVCGMTHLCVWHDSFMCVAWLIYVCDMTHLCVWHDSFMCVAWLIYVCGMTHCHEYIFMYMYMYMYARVIMCDVRVMYACVTWHIPVSVCVSIRICIAIYICIFTCDWCVMYVRVRCHALFSYTLSLRCDGLFTCTLTLLRCPFWYTYTRCLILVYLDSFTPATWLIHTCHDSFIPAMTHPHTPDSFEARSRKLQVDRPTHTSIPIPIHP